MAKIFSPVGVESAMRPATQDGSTRSGEEIVPAAEKLSACKRAEMLFYAFSSRLGQAPFPPDSADAAVETAVFVTRDLLDAKDTSAGRGDEQVS